MITDEMVETAARNMEDVPWEMLGYNAKMRLRISARRVLEAAESLRPKMVEVGEIAAPFSRAKDIYWVGNFPEELPIGTKLYAEQPK